MSPPPLLSRMLHDILDDDHIQWHPPLIGHCAKFWPLLIWTLLPNLTFYLIMRGFNRTFATGATCQQRTLTPPDTWSCPTVGLACVLMSRPISPELVLFPDFLVSNTPRYFWHQKNLQKKWLGAFCHSNGVMLLPTQKYGRKWNSQNLNSPYLMQSNISLHVNI